MHRRWNAQGVEFFLHQGAIIDFYGVLAINVSIVFPQGFIADGRAHGVAELFGVALSYAHPCGHFIGKMGQFGQ